MACVALELPVCQIKSEVSKYDGKKDPWRKLLFRERLMGIR